MTQLSPGENPDTGKILEKLRQLEMRLEQVEKQFGPALAPEDNDLRRGIRAKDIDLLPGHDPLEVDETLIESRIGEYGLAWLGSLVLLFGIYFLMTFTGNLGYPVFASILGYLSVACIFILAHILRRSFPHMVFMLYINGQLLLFYITLRLHFFTPNPILGNEAVDLGLLLVLCGVQVYFALRKRSETLAGIAFVLALATGIISDSLHFTMAVDTAIAALALWVSLRNGWWRLMIITLILVYASHILWLIGNPVTGHTIEMIPSHPYNPVYLFITGILFALVTVVKTREGSTVHGLNTVILLNGLFFSLEILLVTVIYHPTDYVTMYSAISLFCLGYSVWLHKRGPNLFVPAFFACFGFMAMSVAVYGYAKLPDAYFFLALQSFLVVSVALWFRSRIIVVVNSVLYAFILLVYLAGSPPVDRVNFCFAFVAFGTARILNWKKERLTLKTDLLRNMYLAALFFTILYAFYHAVPGWYITLSWTAVAAGYFLMSVILKNIKYRWMAIATLLVTVVYLFVVDLSHLPVGFRVIAFLFLAVISISASLYYTRKVKMKKNLSPGSGMKGNYGED
jgi:hypothetical protein